MINDIVQKIKTSFFSLISVIKDFGSVYFKMKGKVESDKFFWEIEQGKVESDKFFKVLLQCFPDANAIFFEGTVIADEVRKCYESYRQPGSFLPGSQTIFPKSNKIRCEFSPALVNELILLAQRFSKPELLDHLSLYKDDELLLNWHDAFGNIIIIPHSVPEKIVAKFAKELGLAYEAVS